MIFVLIHSALVGPFSWSLVADALRADGKEAVVPALSDTEASTLPFWQQYAASVAGELAAIPVDRDLCLVGHSGAGPLLPAIRQAIRHPVVAYVFVDAGLPRDGASYLDLLAAELPDQVEPFRQMLAAGGCFPNWDDRMLQSLIPDAERRSKLLAELKPRPLAFFEEPIPVFSGWPDASCYYLQLSPAYAGSAAGAREKHWPVIEIEAGHFHMLVDPVGVKDAILQLLER